MTHLEAEYSVRTECYGQLKVMVKSLLMLPDARALRIVRINIVSVPACCWNRYGWRRIPWSASPASCRAVKSSG
jgi:hypothetical protein